MKVFLLSILLLGISQSSFAVIPLDEIKRKADLVFVGGTYKIETEYFTTTIGVICVEENEQGSCID